MSAITKIFVGLIVVIVVIVAGVAIAASTLDINQYRDQIAAELSKQTGRQVKFGGPIKFAVSKHGIGLAIENASIGNPGWASRPEMAKIGKLELGVALMPLLEHKVVVTKLDISDADIQLETSPSNQHNWDLKPAGAAETPAKTSNAATAPASSSGKAVGVQIDELSIADSQLAMRDKDGKISTFKVNNISMGPGSRGATVSADADYNGTPVKLTLKTGAANLMADSKWPFDADATYANYHFEAQGVANVAGKSVQLTSYELSADGSALHGELTANASGAKTQIKGTIASDKLDPADFKMPESKSGNAAPAPAQNEGEGGGSKQLFSAELLDLSALNSADATLDMNIGSLTLGKVELKQVTGKLVLAEGTLTLTPLKASLGDSTLQGSIKLAATPAPARYTVSFNAPGVDIASLLKMIGTEAFISGKGDADIELSGAGNSLHDMAGSTNGHITITASGGAISAAAAGNVASGLTQIFAPGTANPVLNCAALRFNVANGVAKDNGILADSSASTVAGSGGFNLGNETVDLILNAKPKLVNTKGLTPAVHVSGPLASAKVSLDAAGIVQNVAGMLLKGSVGGGSAESLVPTMQTAPEGQNACIYTLDHKSAAASSASPNSAVKGVSGTPSNLKDMGNQLMKGLLGH